MRKSTTILSPTRKQDRHVIFIRLYLAFFLILIVPFSPACKSSATIKNSKSNNSSNITIVQETGKPLTYQEMVKRFDINKDGVLDDYEIEEAQKKLGTRQPDFSKSNTGENQTIRRALILPGEKESKAEDQILDKYDLNRDGVLDEAEVNLLKNDLKYGASTTNKPIKPKKESTVVTSPVIKTKRNPIVR